MVGLIIGLFSILVLVIVGLNASSKGKEKQAAERDIAMRAWTENLDHIKVLGTRSAVNTIGAGEYRKDVNSTLYSLLFVYNDGSQRTKEVEQDDMHYYEAYIRA